MYFMGKSSTEIAGEMLSAIDNCEEVGNMIQPTCITFECAQILNSCRDFTFIAAAESAEIVS